MSSVPIELAPDSRCLRLVATGLGIAWLVASAGCTDSSSGATAEAAPARSRPPVPVAVVELASREFVDRIEAIGTARADESVTITAQVTETVSRVRFEDGAQVEAGQILVELTSREESAQLAEAEANYAEARRQYARTSELFAGGTASRARLDEHTAARDAARARLSELDARMRDRTIKAPFDGVLGLRAVSTGTLVEPGDEITTLDDIDPIKLDFSVPERFVSVLRPGLAVEARAAAYPDRGFLGVVRAIDARVDPATRAVRVRAELANPDAALKPGMLLTAEISANPSPALAIPEEAIVPRGTRRYVFVLDGPDLARRVEIQTGRRDAGWVELVAGLEGGERVVVEGGATLRSGAAVRVVEAPRSAGDAPAVVEPEGADASAAGA